MLGKLREDEEEEEEEEEDATTDLPPTTIGGRQASHKQAFPRRPALANNRRPSIPVMHNRRDSSARRTCMPSVLLGDPSNAGKSSVPTAKEKAGLGGRGGQIV